MEGVTGTLEEHESVEQEAGLNAGLEAGLELYLDLELVS